MCLRDTRTKRANELNDLIVKITSAQSQAQICYTTTEVQKKLYRREGINGLVESTNFRYTVQVDRLVERPNHENNQCASSNANMILSSRSSEGIVPPQCNQGAAVSFVLARVREEIGGGATSLAKLSEMMAGTKLASPPAGTMC